MEERFGLIFVILDRAYLTRVRQERGFGVNPWRTHSRFLVSHNLLIDPTYADPMREWLGEMQPGGLLILGRGPPRRAVEWRALRDRDEVHPCDPRSRRSFRAPPVPVRHASQRPFQQFLHLARAARSIPFHPRGAGPGQERVRRRDGSAHQGRHSGGSGWLSRAGGCGASPSRICRRTRRSLCSRAFWTSTADCGKSG